MFGMCPGDPALQRQHHGYNIRHGILIKPSIAARTALPRDEFYPLMPGGNMMINTKNSQ